MKMLGLAALAAVAAMAFIGASSASAAFPTQLCKVNEGLTCPAGQAATLIHLVNSPLKQEGFPEIPTLLNNTADVLCLNVLARAVLGELTGGKHKDPVTGEELLSANGALGNNTQQAHTTSLSFTNCGTNSTHNNCTVTVTELSLGGLLKYAAEEASLTFENGKTRVKCTILGFIKIDCEYDATGLLFKSLGAAIASPNGSLHALKTPVKFIKGEGPCPEKENTLDGLLLPLEAAYIKS